MLRYPCGMLAVVARSIVLLVLFSWLPGVAVAQSARFTFTGSLNTPRANHTATSLNNGKVLLVGGMDSGNNVLTTSEVYDPVRGSFTASGRLATPREGYTATLLNNGKVLIVGGWNRTSLRYLPSAELYDPTTGTFAPTGMLNIARGYHTATALSNGMILILGGSDNTFRLQATAELYNPATGVFTRSGALIMARSNHTATLLSDGKVLVVGGRDTEGNTLASAEIYNPTSGTFSATGRLITGSYFHIATLLDDGCVLVAGGITSTSEPTARAEIYDSVAGTFTGTGSLATARYSSTATRLNDGQVLIAAGSGTGVLGSAELYDATAGTFATTGSLNVARNRHAAALLTNGTVLITGGTAGSGTLPSAEIYQLTEVAPSSLQITPSNVTMLVGETRQFTAVDNLGHPRADAMWTVSDETLATITTDSAPYLTALAAGTVTLTATAQGVPAQTQVIILDQALDPGAVRWSAPAVSGFSALQIVQALGTNAGPDLYSLNGDGRYTVVRAFAADGQQMWQNWLPVVNGNSVADGFGGLIVTIYNTCDRDNPMGIVDLDAATGQPVWQVIGQSTCTVDAPQLAIRRDGTVVVASPGNTSGFPELMLLDGRTGRPLQAPQIPLSSYVQSDGRTIMGYSPIGPPMVDSDGNAYVEYEVRNVAYPPRITSAVLWLLKIAPDGTATTRQLSSTTADENLFPGRIIPDGQGGVVATWVIAPSRPPAAPHPFQAAHVAGGITVYNLPIPPQELLLEPSGLPVNPMLVLGEDGSAFASYGSHLVSFDVGSGAVNWSYSATRQRMSIIASDADDGIVAKTTDASGTDRVIQFTSSGTATPAPWTGTATNHLVGNLWTGAAVTGALTVRAAESIDVSTTGWFSPTQKGRNRAVFRYDDHQSAAFALLNTIRPLALVNHEEWGGLICTSGPKFQWSRFVTSHDSGFVDVLGQTTCAPYGSAVADVHVHTVDGETAPSYLGQYNDINTANAHPELVFYLAAPTPNHTPPEPQFIRYQGPDAVNNIWYWRDGQWRR